MIPKQTDKRQRNSSALVITLLGVVLLTIVAVAFMQTMSLALTTAKSYADIRRATLAAQGGLDAAVAQITLATGTNMAFVTGLTDYPSAGFPITVIGAGNLTNFDQMMPLVSGPIDYLSNFGTSGFSNNFSAYASPRTSTDPTQTVDVNTAQQYIESTNAIPAGYANMYRASWVVMTNMVGARASYTRYAYVVLDDSARVNPTLMTGTGVGVTNGFTNPTNWYAGPQDITLTSVSAPLLNANELQQATNPAIAYSDATLGEAFDSRDDYEAVKHLFTSQTNASFDVIPAGMTDGGKPKYNINDLATNTIYGSTAPLRASNLAAIITRNLPKFYMRDPALNATNSTLYINRLAANIVDYINPDGAWPASEFTTNFTGVSPQGNGVFPVEIAEQMYAPTGGGGTTTTHTSATISTQFWLACWNPFTTPVTIKSAVLHVWNRPSFRLGTGSPVNLPNYQQPVSIVSPNVTVQPNEFVVLGFPPAAVTTVTCTTATTAGPTFVVSSQNGGTSAPYEQYSLTVNGQTVSQTPNQTEVCGLQSQPPELLSANHFMIDWFSTDGTAVITGGKEVGDPRFQSYYYTVWEATQADADYAGSAGSSYWKGGCPYGGGGGRAWIPAPRWTSRDNIARTNVASGSYPSTTVVTPDQVADAYSSSDASAAPEVIRNGPMISIGELGHVFDPAYANDNLTTVTTADGSGWGPSPYMNGGARSLRIGRPEATSTVSTDSWDQDGERAIDLLDLFTINNTNTVSSASSVNYTNLVTGGALGRINPNTASTNVLAAVFSGIQINSDTGMGGAGTLANVAGLAEQVVANRPYSKLSDLYKVMPIFDANTNYLINSTNFATVPNTLGNSTLNVFNRVHQEAFGKWVQHLTVQSRAYRIYVIGQVLDSEQNPHSSVAMEVGINLQYNPTEAKYDPVIQYVRFLK